LGRHLTSIGLSALAVCGGAAGGRLGAESPPAAVASQSSTLPPAYPVGPASQTVSPVQPIDAPILPLAEVKAGQVGEVWTVFAGTQPEPFTVEVTGIVRNALGPGKSIILCRMTDPRVQDMGAVAGMSGSPLYIGGRFAGALSYQLQRFETIRYAGFTPAEDMAEAARVEEPPPAPTGSPAEGSQANPAPGPRSAADGAPLEAYRPLQPTFSLGGLSPAVAELMAPHLSALGLAFSALGGSSQGSAAAGPAPALGAAPFALRPGDAVSVALATGDITLAGTGTVSRVTGGRVIAFGHPMLGLGQVQLPMCATDIVTILPSTLESTKIANVGAVIGRIDEDRLSAISGTLGPGPAMIDVAIAVDRPGAEPRRLHFQVVRQPQLTPVLVATGVSEAILGSNEAGLSNGFRLKSTVTFAAGQRLDGAALYAGPQSFQQGLNDFLIGLAGELQNPYEEAFPSRVEFQVEPLIENPSVTLDQVQLSRTAVRAGDPLTAALEWRDYQGATHRTTVEIPVDAAWTGQTLEVIAAPGRVLDELTGRPRILPAGELRSFDAYLDAVRQHRPGDGLSLAVVQRSALFTDQTATIPEEPGSIERIAHRADELRYQRRDALLVLWEIHLLPGKVVPAIVRRAFQVVP